jgi:subtilisin family serine protease
MRYFLLFILVMIMASISAAEPVRVAVIDTGYNGDPSKLCKDGHYDFFAKTKTVGRDQQGHGTTVANAIVEYAENADFCLVIYKVFGAKGQTGTDFVPRAIRMAKDRGAQVINMSLDGSSFFAEERQAMVEALSKHIVIFTVAGNGVYDAAGRLLHTHDLDVTCKSYPACYKLPGVIVVGAQDDFGKIRGNRGASVINEYEPWCYRGTCGTSLSTAIATGKFLAGFQ